MDEKQRKSVDYLLQTAAERLDRISGDIPAFNILSALQMEHLETQAHSRIIFYLLSKRPSKSGSNDFLQLFLKMLNIPQKFLCDTWNVYRERAFDSGAGRIDFVIESAAYCAVIEMKISARDGDSQLARYEAFAQKKEKPYRIYYLTLDGHPPEEQSAQGIETGNLRCISFKKEIIQWLLECMKYVKENGYQYSFLKQYLGAIQQITNTNDGGTHVKDLLNDSAMLKAAQLIADSFYEKMYEIQVRFFLELNTILRRRTKLETALQDNAVNIYLKKITYRKRTCIIKLFVDFDPCLETGIAFCESIDNEAVLLSLNEAEKTFPTIYREWMTKLESLQGVPKFRKWTHSRYFILEDTRGARLNFRDHTAQITLVDEMHIQCESICDYIINRMIKPLLQC